MALIFKKLDHYGISRHSQIPISALSGNVTGELLDHVSFFFFKFNTRECGLLTQLPSILLLFDLLYMIDWLRGTRCETGIRDFIQIANSVDWQRIRETISSSIVKFLGQSGERILRSDYTTNWNKVITHLISTRPKYNFFSSGMRSKQPYTICGGKETDKTWENCFDTNYPHQTH